MKGLLGPVALAMTGLLPIVLAAPSILMAKRDGFQEVSLRVKFDKVTTETSITIWSLNSDILGETCSTLLNSGSFAAFPISSSLDENGAGNITLGTGSYLVHENPEFSGGILTCGRMYNDVDSFVNCKALVPASLQLSPLLKREACFTNTDALDMERTSLAFTEAASMQFSDPKPLQSDSSFAPQQNDTHLESRQNQCQSYQTGTQMIGDGDPHQNYFHQQLSETINCGAAPRCDVGYTQTRSLTAGWTASASLTSWISGGYAVSTSFTSGNNWSCGGNSYQTVCIWYNFAHTAYSVQNYRKNVCYGDNWSDRFVLHSPNTSNRGGGYYCVIGTCRSVTDNYWDRNGRAGGP